ncbi:hypothetical protein [Streptomyces scopuliridis]|uniref:hypothetical protein n=1 Tax=Streptomyces scopuliridis TaxID=452529 RepID=UPI002DDAF7FE|nr:hypothetical protein [Streptomyces scopuliridis]
MRPPSSTALGRCRRLERLPLTVACAIAVMYLNARGIPVGPSRDQLIALAYGLCDPGCTAARIAEGNVSSTADLPIKERRRMNGSIVQQGSVPGAGRTGGRDGDGREADRDVGGPCPR